MTTNAVNSRELILEILLSVTRDKMYSHLAIRSVLEKYQFLEKQERSFITRVSEGTLENMIQIDYIINQFSKVKVNKMKPVIRCILRMSVYQLKYMDAVPASAACNEAVKLAERKGFRNLKGFVNGVLRNISRNLDTVVYPDENTSRLEFLSVTYSIPQWMISQWEKDYGVEKTRAILEAFHTEAKTTIRTNLEKIAPEELKQRLESQGITVLPLTVEEFPEFNYAFSIEGFDYIQAIPEFEEGLFYIQDISSMLVAEIAAPKEGSQVIDVCAAPGGKSLHVAQKMHGTGLVEARDLTEYKVGLIEDNIYRNQAANVTAVQADATELDESWVEKADLVIADLPCSGLGVLRKKTDIRYQMSVEQEKELQQLQRKILSVVHQYVKPGGTLMYSTCTMNNMENTDNTEWFLQTYPEFTKEKELQMFPDSGISDGFYIVKFRKK